MQIPILQNHCYFCIRKSMRQIFPKNGNLGTSEAGTVGMSRVISLLAYFTVVPDYY